MHGKETSDTSDVQHDPRLDAIQKALLGAISAAPTFDQEIRDDSLVSPFPISSGFVPASQGRTMSCFDSVNESSSNDVATDP